MIQYPIRFLRSFSRAYSSVRQVPLEAFTKNRSDLNKQDKFFPPTEQRREESKTTEKEWNRFIKKQRASIDEAFYSLNPSSKEKPPKFFLKSAPPTSVTRQDTLFPSAEQLEAAANDPEAGKSIREWNAFLRKLGSE
ncbi:MAG: hypothetical protein SNF33_02845 [Candidatus Algichlamydia australiensis]|nr:hypothetical protein [Chlamydiales bacterium]